MGLGFFLTLALMAAAFLGSPGARPDRSDCPEPPPAAGAVADTVAPAAAPEGAADPVESSGEPQTAERAAPACAEEKGKPGKPQ